MSGTTSTTINNGPAPLDLGALPAGRSEEDKGDGHKGKGNQNKGIKGNLYVSTVLNKYKVVLRVLHWWHSQYSWLRQRLQVQAVLQRLLLVRCQGSSLDIGSVVFEK